MIDQSFIFLDKIGQVSEQKIWKQELHSWDDFVNTRSVQGISARRKIAYNLALEKARKNLSAENMDYFAHHFPQSEHWRLWNHFKDNAVFLDIETSGFYGDITVIGLFNGEDTKIMVKGHNLYKELLQKELKN